jgi:preprotein translocase subunit SecE
MAESYDNPNQKPTGPKKGTPAGKPALPARTGLTAEAQRRAQSMAKAQPTSPQQFFQEAWVELKKTSWPNRDVLTKSTSVVLALVVAVAVWVGVIDGVLTAATNHLHIFSAR